MNLEHSIYIKRVSLEDDPIIDFILREYIDLVTLYDDFSEETLEELVEKEQDFISNHIKNFFAVYDRNEFIGIFSLLLQQDFYLIRDFYISSDLRSKGYGAETLNFCISKARYDVKNLSILLYKTNTRAIRFFERHNFEKIGTIKNKYLYRLAMTHIQEVEQIKK